MMNSNHITYYRQCYVHSFILYNIANNLHPVHPSVKIDQTYSNNNKKTSVNKIVNRKSINYVL